MKYSSEDTLKRRQLVPQAAIRVERIKGPILLISAGDDHIWPSTPMARDVMTRLSEREHPFPSAHLSFDDAGHFIHLPGYTLTVPFEGKFGGTVSADARARKEGWQVLLSFLEAHL